MKAAKPTDWGRKPLPEKRVTISLDRTFSSSEMKHIRKGLVPEQMEDKWFIYWKDNTLYFHRSWTGFCIYVVRFASEGGKFTMVEVDVNRDPEQHTETSDERDKELISYLVDVLLLKRPADFPGDDESPEMNSIKNWGFVGRAMLGQSPEDE